MEAGGRCALPASAVGVEPLILKRARLEKKGRNRPQQVPSGLPRIQDLESWTRIPPSQAQHRYKIRGSTMRGRVMCVFVEITLNLYFRTV